MPSVKFSSVLAAAHIPPRGDPTPAFVHGLTGDVLFISAGDADMAAKWFPVVAGDLVKLRAVVSNSPDWLAVPKHEGQPMELKGFVERWCGENGFTTEHGR